jgi:post-segregation antitoxin (ccd killing protein)
MASSYVPAWDFSGLNSLGDSIASGIKAFRQKQLLSDLGNDLQSGNYAAAAGKAFQAGSLDTGLSLLKLGQQKEADAAALGALTGSGSSLSPIGGGSSPSGNLSARDAIAGIESKGSGDYSAVGPVTGSGDRAYGRYQVMGNNIGPWTQQALGRALTPQEFLASPEAQNKTFDTIFGGYLQKYGPRDAASMWFTGKPLSEGAGLSDVNGMTGNRYVDKFMSAYSPTAGAQTQVADASGAVPASAGASAGGGDIDRLQARISNLTRALATPNISQSTRAAIQAEIENTRSLITRADRMDERTFRRQQLEEARKDREETRRSRDVAYQNRQREAEADRLGLQGDDRLQYITSGRVPSGAEKQTGEQANAATFATRMAEADKILSDPAIYSSGLGMQGAAKAMTENIPIVGNFLAGKGETGPQFQQYRQAQRDFVNAVLRKESGAAISQSEFDNASKQYFPQPGDTPQVIAQKAKNRQTAIDTIANAGSPSFRKSFAEKRGAQLQAAPPEQIARAKQALAAGVPREKVIETLKSLGFGDSGL